MIQNPHPDYRNNFDEDKQYAAISFLAGAPLQASELNELQDIQSTKTEKLADYLISSGTILSGGEVKSLSASQVEMAGGTVSCQGKLVLVQGAVLSLDLATENTVGVRLVQEIVTAQTDPSIAELDPKSPHYGEETSHRVKVTGVWVVSEKTNLNGDLFFPVLTIQNGNITGYISNTKVQDYVSSSISVYDKGVHGSYVVDGLVITNVRDDTRNHKHVLAASSGTARIQGIEVKKGTETVFYVDTAEADDRQVNSEPVTFRRGQLLYGLRNNPLKAITKVTGTKRVTKTVTRGGSAGGADALPDTPVLRITQVTQGGTTYSAGKDFTQTGDRISWQPNGAEPSPGSNYVVEYEYVATFNGSVVNGRLNLSATDANALVDQSTLSIWYTFYLNRIDRVVMSNVTREIKVLKGVPNIPTAVLPPAAASDSEISLATITVSYGVAPVIDMDSTVHMIPFSTLKKMNNQIADLQFNVAQLSLIEEARALDPVTTKKGVIVDSLSNENMRDKGIPQNALIQDKTLTIGTRTAGQITLTRGNVTLDGLSFPVIRKQEVQTGSQRINPYARPNSVPKANGEATPSIIYGNTWDAGYDLEVLPRSVSVVVDLSGYEASEEVILMLRGEQVGRVQTSGAGAASTTVNIPKGLQYGTYTIEATGTRSKAIAIVPLSIARNDQSYNQFLLNQLDQKQTALLEQQAKDFQGQIDQLRQDLESEVSAINSRLDDLQTQLNSLKDAFGKFQSAMTAELTKLGFRLSDLQTQVDEIRKRLPGFWLHYYDTDQRRTDPNQFLKVYASTEYSKGAIQYNQGSVNTNIGSQMWEVGVTATRATKTRYTVVANDDQVSVWLNGQRVASYSNGTTPRSFDLNFKQGHNVVQVVLNNQGNNLSHLQTSGDFIDGTIIQMNPEWMQAQLTAAQNGVAAHEAEIARQQTARAEAQRLSQAQRTLWWSSRRRTDPIAQSFTLDMTRQLSAIDVFVTELPTRDLSLKIVETTAGQPNIERLVGYGELALSKVVKGWNTIPLLTQTILSAGVEYAFIVITESFEGQIGIGKVGDKATTGTFVQTQLDAGVMFISANENTWTAVQDTDVCFRMKSVNFATSKTVKLGTIPAQGRTNNLTDFRLVGSQSTSSSTSIEYYMQIGSNRYPLGLNETTFVPAVAATAGNIDIYAVLNTTDSSETPIIGSGLTLVYGLAETPATYVARQFTIPNGLIQPAKIQVVLSQLLPASTNITVSLQTDTNTWTPVPRKQSVQELGEGWVDVLYEIPDIQKANGRIKIELTTDNYANRPAVKNIRTMIV